MLHFFWNFPKLLWNFGNDELGLSIRSREFFAYRLLTRIAPLTIRENNVSLSVILNDVGCVFWHFLWEFEYEDFLLL